MKTYVLLLTLLASHATATVVSQGTILQPINLVAASDAHRIPLGPVVCESNHGYDIRQTITAPRPNLHGTMPWKNIPTIEQNLASSFGITLEIPDDTTPTSAPIGIRLNSPTPPPYSPYTHEQVVAAIIHCLLDCVHCTPKHPLIIDIRDDANQTAPWHKHYEKSYHNALDPDSPTPPTPPAPLIPEVHGTKLHTDKLGITYVTFPHIKPNTTIATYPPILIPYQPIGEGDSTDAYQLLPLWPGESKLQALNQIARPWSLIYDCHNPHQSYSHQANALQHHVNKFTWNYQEHNNTLTAGFYQVPDDIIVAALTAAILTNAPTKEEPLHIILDTLQSGEKISPSFQKDPQWKTTDDWQSCEATFHLLPNGSINNPPLIGTTITSSDSGPIFVQQAPLPATAFPESELPDFEPSPPPAASPLHFPLHTDLDSSSDQGK